MHGYWINEIDVLFFAGDTAALSRFLRGYAGLHLIPPPEQPLSEWELYRPKSRAAVMVDVTRIDNALRAPLSLEVRAGTKADDAVRRFVSVSEAASEGNARGRGFAVR